jgi:hypothetical protein
MDRYVSVRMVGHQLTNGDEEVLKFMDMEWPALLGFGYIYGWMPNSLLKAGLMDRESARKLLGNRIMWVVDYGVGDPATIEAEDMARLADAIEVWLKTGKKQKQESILMGEVLTGASFQTPQYVYERFSGSQKRRLINFVEFCRKAKSDVLAEPMAEFTDLGPIEDPMLRRVVKKWRKHPRSIPVVN